MKIQLQKLTLINFKGIRHLVIPFEQVTNIFGDNATGKTTLFDAFLFLLFGKDSTDRKDFEIKTLDENNQPYHRLDHEVEGVLDINGTEVVIRRSYKEKWVKKRGSSEEEFKGHETTFFWNDVPLQLAEFQEKVSEIINENIFKLITNTNYFNSLKWQDRRSVLLKIAGAIDNNSILDKIATLKNKDAIIALTTALNQKKSIEEFKKEIGAKKKKIKDELDLIPARIQEANRALPEEKNFDEIDRLIAQVTGDIENVEGLLMNKSQAVKDHQANITILLNNRQGLNRLMLDIESNIRNDVQDRKRVRDRNINTEKSELSRLNDELIIARKGYATAESRKKLLDAEQDVLRKQWTVIDAEKLEFNDGQFCCPTCKREYEAGDVEAKKGELTRNFNTEKSRRLNEITNRGQEIGIEIKDIATKLANLVAKGEELKGRIETATNRIAELETENTRLSADDSAELERFIAGHAQYQQCKKDIESLNEQINAPFVSEDTGALLQRKRELMCQLDQHKAEASTKDQREKQQDRIKELTDQELAMNQELANLEGTEFCIEQFTKAKMDELETRINGRFKIVRFKLFEEQINGGESEACTTLINGVPYSDANTASKIQAGIDIINVLNEHYGIEAPVWVDNRESVVRLPETNCQLINLFVSAPDKKLRIEAGAKAMAMA